MPRSNADLKYVKRDRAGRLTYRRQIPPALRHFFGGRSQIQRSFGIEFVDINDPNCIARWTALHQEVEALLNKAAGKNSSALVTQSKETFPLRKKDIAGIAAEVLLEIRRSVETEQFMTTDRVSGINALIAKIATNSNNDFSFADFGLIAKPVLDDLGIQPSESDLEALGKQLIKYIPVMREDMKKLQDGDYSSSSLQQQAPGLPIRSASWSKLFDNWLVSCGGILQEDGYGISEDRSRAYEIAIKEFQKHISRNPPNELTKEDARRFVDYLQRNDELSIRTKQYRLGCLSNLFQITVKRGELDVNIFSGLEILTPDGLEDLAGYRSFTRQELTLIFTLVQKEKRPHNRLLLYILLCTGCRLAEAIQLRTSDIKQTTEGIWYIDFKHEPLAEFPTLLKMKKANERMMPIHPKLIQKGLLKINLNRPGRLLNELSSNSKTSSISNWFARRLKKIGIWEKRKTVLHSFRNNFKDFCREAGIPHEYRSAFCGHRLSDVGEANYGKQLTHFPDRLYRELIKIDFNWIP